MWLLIKNKAKSPEEAMTFDTSALLYHNTELKHRRFLTTYSNFLAQFYLLK